MGTPDPNPIHLLIAVSNILKLILHFSTLVGVRGSDFIGCSSEAGRSRARGAMNGACEEGARVAQVWKEPLNKTTTQH